MKAALGWTMQASLATLLWVTACTNETYVTIVLPGSGGAEGAVVGGTGGGPSGEAGAPGGRGGGAGGIFVVYDASVSEVSADGPRDAVLEERPKPICPDLDENSVPDCMESVLENPDFRTGATGWTAEASATQVFATSDGDGNGSSGSLAVTNTFVSSGSGSTMAGSAQCVAINSSSYTFRAQVTTAPGSSGVFAGSSIQYFEMPSCTGTTAANYLSQLIPAGESSWKTISGIVAPMGGTRSARVRLIVLKPVSDPATTARFDNILLRAN